MKYSKKDCRLTKDIEKDLKTLSEQLPPLDIQTHEFHILTGAEILEWGTIDEIDGKPIDPEAKYDYANPVIIRANHYRRLRRVWKKNSIDGVLKYLAYIKKLKEKNA